VKVVSKSECPFCKNPLRIERHYQQLSVKGLSLDASHPFYIRNHEGKVLKEQIYCGYCANYYVSNLCDHDYLNSVFENIILSNNHVFLSYQNFIGVLKFVIIRDPQVSRNTRRMKKLISRGKPTIVKGTFSIDDCLEKHREISNILAFSS
jgi:hypothetical protein